jgi:hypothetical protein
MTTLHFFPVNIFFILDERKISLKFLSPCMYDAYYPLYGEIYQITIVTKVLHAVIF